MAHCYEILIVRDALGYWFDIHKVTPYVPIGDDKVETRVKELVHSNPPSEPFQSRDEAIVAARDWITEKEK